MKIEQVPGKPLRSPPPAAANIAREVHNLIQCVLIAAQVSSSSKPPMTRVAIVRNLHTAASVGFEGAPCHDILHTASIPAPHLAAACAILCDDPPLWTNFPPPLLRRPASSKRGPRESSDELKAKYLLAPVMMEAAAAQRFTFSTTSSSSRSLSLLCSDGARSCNFWHDLIGCGCNYECRTVRCVSCVFRVLGLA